MTYTPRQYEEVVRDLLTTLTRGTTGETVSAPPEGSLVVPQKLMRRPVRRISFLQGPVQVGTGDNVREITYRFTSADFELISSTGDDNKDTIRFREKGRRPIPGRDLTVNYYPVSQPDPTPLTDLSVGSVVRTLMETVGRELAVSYLHLGKVYDSAFLGTAEGSSLDRVVALVGVTRLQAGHPVATVRFSRRPGTPGVITIPAGTAITDVKGNRYLTLQNVTLEPNESTRDVQAGGASAGTAAVEQGELNRPEITIAGIAEVANPQPARRLTAAETDDELRRRAAAALHGVVRGTLDALRFGLLSIEGVKEVGIVEAPNGVDGEIRLTVVYTQDTPEVRALVERRIEELRPAGIRVIRGEAKRIRLGVRAELLLAGTGLAAAELSSLTRSIEEKLTKYLTGVTPGGRARRAQMTSLILADPRVVDAKVALVPEGEPEAEELAVDAGSTLDVLAPFQFVTTAERSGGPAPATVSTVSAVLPVHLVAAVTLADASQAINLALAAHLASRRPDTPLNVDGLAAALRDDTRFALVRSDILVTVETGAQQFLQLTDGIGSYAPAANESLQAGAIDVQVREGGV
ncbi:MAG TPA: hypothetical protein VJB57_15615 [Dehalococcoidia bacterium]|nr:hypothetical protein [Dehalococcoidia bacterium]